MAADQPRETRLAGALPTGWILAPDGIPVRPIALAAGGLVGLAEGALPPGDYGVHLHYSLEQVTYVLSGRVRVQMGDPDEVVELGPGEALLTLPGRTLSFHNDGPADARVLFICTPPYPPDDSDTGRPTEHRPMNRSERVRAAERRQAALDMILARLAAGGREPEA
jgi:mannose-6-phosphate isomerase-like protein (cupin superfamily)